MVAVVPCSCPLQRLLGEHDEVHLSALGMAVSTMVSIVEILKKDGLAVESREPLFGGSTQRTPPESLHASRPSPPAAASSQPTAAHIGANLRQPPVQRQPHAATHHVACCRSAPLPVAGLSTTMEILGEDRQRPVQKAKMEIVLHKSPDFHDIIAAEATAAAEAKAAEGEDS